MKRMNRRQIKVIISAIAVVFYIFQNGFDLEGLGLKGKNSNNNNAKKYNKHNNGSNKSQKYNQEAGYSYLSLVLSWSPTYCAESGGRKSSKLQCGSSRAYSFVLHGLWPQHDSGYPSYCKLPKGVSSRIDNELITSMLDIMPARSLVKHEYEKHGTCMGVSSNEYYDISKKLYSNLNFPETYRNIKKPFFTTAEEIRDSFISKNPGLTPNMIAVNCSGGNQNRLKEVKVCYNKQGEFRDCGKNEKVNRLCRGKKVLLPPVRG